MKAFIGIVLVFGGLALLPLPATILLGVSYAVAAGALVVALVSGALVNVGIAVLKS